MESAFGYLLILISSCLMQIGTQIVFSRQFSNKSLYFSLIAGFSVGLGLLAGLHWTFLSNTSGGAREFDYILANLAVYLCFGYTYFHFNNMGETARRVRLVRELAKHPEGMTMEELAANYPAEEILRKRISRLLLSGQMREVDGKFQIANPSLLAAARMVQFTKWLVMGRKSSRD